MYLSVIIPAYNEEKRIEATLRSVDSYLSKEHYEYEIIVVNDGSSDGTTSVVKDLSKIFPKLKLISYGENMGKGYAVKRGMLEANGDFRLFMDADSSTSIDQVGKLFLCLLEGYDVAISSRRISGADVIVDQPIFRVFLGLIFRTIIQTIIPLGVKDSQNGFKLFTANAAKTLFSKQTIFRWAFDVEILALARSFKYKIKEVPIIWRNNSTSKVTLNGMFNMLLEISRIRLNLWSGRY